MPSFLICIDILIIFIERSSSPNSTDAEICYRDPGRLLLEDSEPSSQQNPVVTNLASAILQVAQSVERKYLQKPLGKSVIIHRVENWHIFWHSERVISPLESNN